jgi:hypothetical protein
MNLISTVILEALNLPLVKIEYQIVLGIFF